MSYVGEGNGGLYKTPARKKDESERLRKEGDKIQCISLGFERGKVAGFRKGRRKQAIRRWNLLQLPVYQSRKPKSSRYYALLTEGRLPVFPNNTCFDNV